MASVKNRLWHDLTGPGTAVAHDRADWLGFGLLAVIFALVFQLGVPLRASFGARITGDEPFYLLTTESLLADRDLDLTNQYDLETYRRFFDHADPLWYQSVPTASGVLLSPHNVGLSFLVLPAYAAGGVDAVKGFLGVLAGMTIGWAYLLSRRATSHGWASVLAAGLLGLSAPWFVYATQIYPEMPAALLVLVALWLLLGRARGPVTGITVAVLLALIMWLGSKYAPLVSVVTLLALARLNGWGRVWLIGVLAGLGAHYAWFHLATYGGLTPYAVNLIYAGSSTVELVDLHFELGNRLYRLLGLWVDREFGVLRWAPVLSIALAGVWLTLFRTRTAGWILLAPLVAQILVAAFFTVTMRGWWFPGRMLIVALPLLAPLLALALGWIGRRRAGWVGVAPLMLATVETTAQLWRSTQSVNVVLAVNPFDTPGLWLQGTAGLFPLFTAYGPDTIALSMLWLGLLGALATEPAWAPRTQPVTQAGGVRPSAPISP